MEIKLLMFTLLCLGAVGLAGCEGPKQTPEEIEQAQIRADYKIVRVCANGGAVKRWNNRLFYSRDVRADYWAYAVEGNDPLLVCDGGILK